jgi:hypothetical protein
VAGRKVKRSARLPLPWERENSPVRVLGSGRHLFPLLIAGVLFGLFAGAHWLGARRADVRATRATLHEVQRAARAFVNDIGRCPRSTGELVHPPRSGVHYLHEQPVDAWGRAVLLRCSVSGAALPGVAGTPQPSHTDIEVLSAGPSGSFLDDDNIS